MTFAECISVVTAAVILATADANAGRSAEYVAVPGGNLRSVLPADPAQPEVAVARFRLSRKPVTNAEFLAFVRKHADWQRGRAAGIFVDGNYLQHWHSALKLGPTVGPDQPVMQVSWFAALAYCEAQGSRLPTWHEWEFAAAADERVTPEAIPHGARNCWVGTAVLPMLCLVRLALHHRTSTVSTIYTG